MSTEIMTKLDGMATAWEEYKKEQDRKYEAVKNGRAPDPLQEEKLQKLTTEIAKLGEIQEKINALQTAVSRPGAAGQAPDSEGSLIESKQAYLKFLRKGADKLSEQEVKALTDQTDADGGFLIRPEVATTVTQSMTPLSVMRQVANVVQTSGDAIEFLDDSGDFESAWVGEIDARPETGTAQLAKSVILVHEVYAKPFVSQKVIDDSFFNVEAYVNQKLASSFAAKENAAFIAGTGTGQPKGILAYAAGTGAGQIEDIPSGAAGAVTGDALISLVYSLPPEDISAASVIVSPAALMATLKLKDSQGHYLWSINGALANGAPATIMGRPVRLDANLPGVGAGNKPAIAGNFGRAYTIVDRIGLRMLRDPYSAKPYVQFYATKRVGGGVTAPKSIKRLVIA